MKKKSKKEVKFISVGWQCPICKMVYSPNVTCCSCSYIKPIESVYPYTPIIIENPPYISTKPVNPIW
jgi:hypothetical protein